MNVKEGLKYTASHEWVLVDGDTAIVGITDYAQSQLGDIVFVDVDCEDETFEQGEAFGSIEAVKTVEDIKMPVSGDVIEINEVLADQSDLINSDPYGAGWIIKVKMSDSSELDALMDAAAYTASISE